MGAPSRLLALETGGAGGKCGDGNAEEVGTWPAQGWPRELANLRESPTLGRERRWELEGRQRPRGSDTDQGGEPGRGPGSRSALRQPCPGPGASAGEQGG